MDAYECLVTRKSVRSFTDKAVPVEDIKKILEAGINAPSSKHSQPWYLIADTTNKKDLVAMAMEQHEDPVYWNPSHPEKGILYEVRNTRLESARALREAPLAIQIFSDHPYSGGIDLIHMHKNDPNHKQHIISYSVEISSLAACAQNLLLAAHALGYGAFWNNDPIGIANEVKRIYEQPNRDYFATICVGHSDENHNRKLRKPKFEIIT